MRLIELTDLSSLEASTIMAALKSDSQSTKTWNQGVWSRRTAAQHTPREKGSNVNLNTKEFHLGFLASEDKTKMKENP